MRINIINCEINISIFNDDMLRPTKVDNEQWCNHKNVSERAQAPKLVESNLQANISIHLKQSGCHQKRQHIVINRTSNYNQNHDQKAALIDETSKESNAIEVGCKTLVQSSSTSFALLPILDMIYIKPSEVHTGKLFGGSNSSNDKPNNGTNENLTNHSKHSSELREFFKLNQLELQLKQTKLSTTKLCLNASECSKTLVNQNMGHLKMNGNGSKNECKNLHKRGQAESESCFRLTSIEESEEKLPKRATESRNTFKNNDTNQVELKGNNSGVRKKSDNYQELARRIGKPDREGDVVKVGAVAEQMKIQHLQEHNQQLRRRQQQIQLHRTEMRCGCRQQVDAITASSSASIAKTAVAATEIETETKTKTKTKTKTARVVAETEIETETETTTRTGFQVEARLKAMRPNQQADKFVVKAANFEHDLADKQRQQVFCCMLHSRLSLSSPSPSSCSSSSVTPFSSLSIQSTPFQCYHREQTEPKSSSFADSNNLNNKKRENHHLERARSGSRSNKQQEIASSCKKTAQARGEQYSIKNLSSQKNYQTSSVLLKQKTLVSTTKVRDPSSILWCNKEFYPNNDHNSSAKTTQEPQSNHLQKQQSKIEQQQQRQQPDTYLKRNFAPQESRREQIRRPRRKKRPLCVDRIREQIKRQGVAKKWQKDTSCLLAQQQQQQQETITNKLVTPNFAQLTNNNGMIFEDNLNNNSSQGVTKKCSPSFYNNNTDDNKGKLQGLITHKRSSPSSSSSSSSSSTTSSSSTSLALSSSSSSFGRYNSSSLNIDTNSQDKRPLLGEGGLLTNRLIAFDRPLSVTNHTFQSRINTSFNSKQQNKLKTIAEVNPPNSLPQSLSQHHYQANYRRDINMTDQDNSDCEYLATNNLHPLEILDQQTRMCISIYDPLPKPNNNNNNNDDNLKETLRKNCANDKHLQNTSSIDKSGVHSTTRRRQFDKGKENLSYEYSQSNYKTRQVDHLCGSADQKAFIADYDDEKHDDEEERLRESFPLELRKPIIDSPPMRIMVETVNSNPQQQELFDSESDQVGVASLAELESRDNILIVIIETEGNQTKPLHVNPSWTFEELVENVHRELLRLKDETLTNFNSNKFQSQSNPQITTTTHNKTATKLYEEARKLAEILHSNLASSSREYVEGFISPIENQDNHREPLIDPTAMSLSDRARMVGQVERRGGCVEMNEGPCWARIEQQSNEDNLRNQKQQSNSKCDLQNEQKFAIMDHNQNRRLQFRVSNEDKHSRMKSDRDDSSFEYKQSGASEPLTSPHLILPLPHPHSQPHSHPLPASSSSFRSSPDWRQTHLRRSQNRTLYNDRYFSNISNITTSMSIKDKSKGAEFGVAVLDENIAEQTRLAHYLQFEPSCSSNLPLCRQRKCSCITTQNKRPFNYNQNSMINLKRIPDRVMMTKSKDNEKATTSRQNCNSFVTENNRKIDHTTTSSELEDAFSHVSRQSNKPSSSSFSSNSLQLNNSLNRQDNHSKDDKSSTLIMYPVWQTRNRIAETETETEMPDKQKHSGINQTRNKQEMTKSSNDQKDSSLKVKQQMTKKQVTSQPLSYARTVLANKDEQTNRIILSSPIVINDHNADLNADANSFMSNLAEPTTRLRHVASTVSNNSATKATTNLSKQGKVENSQICVKNQSHFGKRLPKETNENEKENENENGNEHENRNGNENEDVDPNFKVYLNKEKSGLFGVARMTLESAELCQEEKQSLLTQHDGQVATNLRAANSYSTALALPAPTSLPATSKTASLLKRQVGTACFCRIQMPIESKTQSKVKSETEAQTSLITSITQNPAPASAQTKTKTKAMPSNQTRLDESICGGLLQGQQKQATIIKLGGDDDNQRRRLFSVAKPAITTSVHGDIHDNNCSSKADDKQISVDSTPASGLGDSMRFVDLKQEQPLPNRKDENRDEEKEEEENVGCGENDIICRDSLQVQKQQQRQQRNSSNSEAKGSISEQFEKKVVAVAKADSLEKDNHMMKNGQIKGIWRETKGCLNKAALDSAAQPSAGVGCATRVKVFCPILPANNKWAKEKEKKEEPNRGVVCATAETTLTELTMSNTERTNNSNSWATDKSPFAGMKSASDKEDTELEKVSFGKVSLLKGEEVEESRRRRRRVARQTERQQQQQAGQVLREKQSIENEDKAESTENGDKEKGKEKAGKVDLQANWSLSAKSASSSSKVEAFLVAGVATSPQSSKQVSWNGAVLNLAVAGRQKEKNEKQRQPVGQAAAHKLSAIQLCSSTVEQRNRNKLAVKGMTGIAGEATIMNADDDYDEREDESITASNSDTRRAVAVSEVGAEVGVGVRAESEVGVGSGVAKASIPTTDATTNTTTTNTCITDCKTSKGRSQAPFLFSQRQQVNSSNGNSKSNSNNHCNCNCNNSIADTKQNSKGHSSKGSTTTDFRERNSNSYSNSNSSSHSHSQCSGNGSSKSNGSKRHRNNSSSASLAGIDCYSNNDISPSQASSSLPSSSSLTHKSSLPSTSKQPLSFALIVTRNNNRDRDVKFVLDKNNNDDNNQQRSVDNNYNIDSNATSKLNKVACLGLDKASSETTTATATAAAASAAATLASTTTTTSNKKTKKQKQKNFKTGSFQKQSVEEEAAVGVAVSFTTQKHKQKIKTETETETEKETEEAEAKAGVEVASDEKQDRIREKEAATADEKDAEEAQAGLEIEAQAQAQAQAQAAAQAATTTKTNDNNPYCNNIQADIFKRPRINHSHNNTNYYLNDVATNSAKQTTFQQPTKNISSYSQVSSSATLPKPQPKPPSSSSSSSSTTTTTITSTLSRNINKLSNIDTSKEQNNFIHSINKGSNRNIDERQRLFNSCYHLATVSKNSPSNSLSTTSNQFNTSYFSSFSSSNTYFNSSDKHKVTTINTKNNTIDEKRQITRNKNSNYSLDKTIREHILTSGNNIDINENNPINLSLSLSQSHLNNSPKMTKSLSSEDTQTSSVKKFGSNNNNNHQDTIYGDRGAPIKQINSNNNNNTSTNINNTKRAVVNKNLPQQQQQQQQSFIHSPSSETTTLSSPNKTSNNKMNPIESDQISVDDSPKRVATSNPPLPSTTSESSSTYTSTAFVNTTSSSSSSSTPEHVVIVDSDIKQSVKHHSIRANDSTTNNNNDNDPKMSSNEDVNNSSSCNINSNEKKNLNKSSPINGKSHSGPQQSCVSMNNNLSQQTTDTSSLPNKSPSSTLHDNSPPKQQQQQQQQQQQSQDANQNQNQHSAATAAAAANNKQRVPSQPPANNRSILIIREIDPKSPESSVRDIFNSENCPSKPVHCDYALHNSWYVTFKDDEDAKLALAYIRKYIVTWNGQPIMARIKPKPAVPSASNQPPSNIVPPMVMQATTRQQQQLLQQISQQPHVENGTSPETGVNISAAIAPSVAAVAANHHQLIAGQPQAAVRVLGASSVSPLTMNPAAVAVPAPDATNSAAAAAARAAAGIGYMRDPNQNHPMLHHLSPMVPHAHHHHHHHHHHQPVSGPHHYGYSAVAFYGQHGPILTPWHYSNAPQYDLSEVFIYNGLTPFPSTVKSTSSNNNSNNNSKMITGGLVSSAALLGGSDHMTATAAAAYHHHHNHNHQNANHLSASNQLSTPIVFGNNGGSGGGVVVGGGSGGSTKGVNKSNHQRNDNHKEFKSNTPTIGSSNGAVNNNNHHHSHHHQNHNQNHHHHNQHHQQQHLSNQTNSTNSSSLQPNVSTNSGGSKRNRNNLVSNKSNNNNNNNSNNGNSNNVNSSYNTAQQQASANSNNQQTSSDNEHLPGRPNRSS